MTRRRESGDEEFRPTDRELDVMSVLWQRGSGTVAEIREELPDPLAYTTVLSVLQTLEQKGYVDHEKVGRAYRYRPLVASVEVGRGAVSRLLEKVYRGSAALLFNELVAERDLRKEELERMRRLLEERIARRGEKGGGR